MPAQVFVSTRQLEVALEHAKEAEAHGVVFLEQPTDNTIMDVWLCEHRNNYTQQHRSILVDEDGEVLGDSEVGDSD